MFLGLVLFGFSILQSPQTWLYLINSLLCLIRIHALAYFLAVISNNAGISSFLLIGLSLMIAFFSGIFVPRLFIHPIGQQIVSLATPI